MEAYTGCYFVCYFGSIRGEYVFNAWKFLETSLGCLMGTAEELFFEDYHGRNSTCLSLCWICARKSWRSFRVSLRVLLLYGTFNNSVTCVHIIFVLLPASTLLSLFFIDKLTVTLILAVVGVYVNSDDGGSVLCGTPCYYWVGAGTVAFVCHHSVGSGTVVLGISGDNTGSFIWGILRYHWVGSIMMTLLCYPRVGARTVVIGVSGCGVAFAALVWQAGPWFIVAWY